jgi:hypothetical protein
VWCSCLGHGPCRLCASWLRFRSAPAVASREQNTLKSIVDGVVEAEMEMLYSLNFNLVVDAHQTLANRLLGELGLQPVRNPSPEDAANNQTRNMIFGGACQVLNDVVSLTTLSCQYPSSLVVPVALLVTAQRIVMVKKYAPDDVPPPLRAVLGLRNDPSFFAARGISAAQAAGEPGPLGRAKRRSHQPWCYARH